MEKSLQSINKETFFKLHEGSNYKVTQTNKKTHIISFEHFKKLAKVLNDDAVNFVSINDTLVNKNRIDDIEPTEELTPDQKLSKSKLREPERLMFERKYGAKPSF